MIKFLPQSNKYLFYAEKQSCIWNDKEIISPRNILVCQPAKRKKVPMEPLINLKKGSYGTSNNLKKKIM